MGLISQHARQGILIDTNVLLVLLVGLVDQGLVGRFKRTESYTPEDFQLVLRLVQGFRRIITTPHILAELTNLSPTGREHRKAARYFGQLVAVLRRAYEHPVAKDVMLGSALLPRIGFTDLSIIEAAKNGHYLVLTDDWRASECARAQGCAVLNLNHLRGAAWLNG